MANALLAAGLLLALALSGSDAMSVQKRHTKIYYSQDNGLSIRNAKSSTADGQFSVSGPCGGNNVFGSNGINEIKAGTELVIDMNYGTGTSGDHKSNSNQFRAAFVCGSEAEKGDQSVLSQSKYTMSTVDTVSAPAGSRSEGYTIKVTLPEDAIGSCTLSILEQRQWGGCIDMNVLETPASQTLYVAKATYNRDMVISALASYLGVDASRVTVVSETSLGMGVKVDFQVSQEKSESGNALAAKVTTASAQDLNLNIMTAAEAAQSPTTAAPVTQAPTTAAPITTTPPVTTNSPVTTSAPVVTGAPGTTSSPEDSSTTAPIESDDSNGSLGAPVKSSTSGSGGAGSSLGIILGVVGAVAGIAVIGVVGFIAYRRRNSSEQPFAGAHQGPSVVVDQGMPPPQQFASPYPAYHQHYHPQQQQQHRY